MKEHRPFLRQDKQECLCHWDCDVARAVGIEWIAAQQKRTGKSACATGG